MSKLLITGFEPFGGRATNLSKETTLEIAKQLDCVDTLILPVSFSKAPAKISATILQMKPEVLIMLGLASKRTKVGVERLAINLMDCTTPDNDGRIPNNESIAPDGDKAYFTDIDVRKAARAIEEAGIPAEVSNSAGLYVCNAVYYSALRCIVDNNLRTKAVFLHLPCISIDDALTAVKGLLHSIE